MDKQTRNAFGIPRSRCSSGTKKAPARASTAVVFLVPDSAYRAKNPLT